MGPPVLDPFEDYETAGYLRNTFGVKDLGVIRHLEAAAFQNEVHGVLRFLRRVRQPGYDDILEVHRRLFASVYPWAGEDRASNAPHLAIVRAGYVNLFAHPADVRRAGEYALSQASEPAYLQAHPGEVFGLLAYAHPFLEGNGRTLLTVFAELCRRAGFFIQWHAVPQKQFLQVLTEELLEPGRQHLDGLIRDYVQPGALGMDETASRLRLNFNRG